MKIDLKHILKRNKISLETFLKKNEIKTYNDLLEYCENKNFMSVSLEEFNKIVLQEKIVLVVSDKKEESDDSRTVIVSQEKKDKRSSGKKKQSSQSVSDSDEWRENTRMAYYVYRKN